MVQDFLHQPDYVTQHYLAEAAEGNGRLAKGFHVPVWCILLCGQKGDIVLLILVKKTVAHIISFLFFITLCLEAKPDTSGSSA